ncbi:MAG: HEAT repeat domain-containing protein [Gemmatimonadaceae bacterium]
MPGTRGEAGVMVESAFSRPKRSRGLVELLARLDGELTTTSAHRLLDELARLTEQYARDGMWTGVAEVLSRVIARESLEADANVRRSFLIQLRRLLKPELLRGVAGVLGKRREMRESAEGIFRRAGDPGVEVLINCMVTSNLTSERRAFRSALARCPEAAMPVMHLLGDPRWYVVRNAADLLGELQVLESDVELVATLKHSDARVRRSAAGALARLATSRALGALRQLLDDPAPSVRLQAVRGLVAGGNVRSVSAVLQALDGEQDVEVQHTMLAALGTLATDAAVERLVQASRPGSLLHRRSSGVRVAAVNALREAGTHAASAALRSLAGDKDREVRAAVEQALGAWRESARAAGATSTVAG